MKRLLAGLFVVGLAGCVTPSIPIPPPDPAKMTFAVTASIVPLVATCPLLVMVHLLPLASVIAAGEPAITTV